MAYGMLIAAMLLTPVATNAAAADSVQIGSEGVLTKCRNWLLTHSCKSYRHVRLPHRISLGDTLFVSFGSDPKEYRFIVGRIEMASTGCTLFTSDADDPEMAERIEVPACRPNETALPAEAAPKG